MHCQICGELLPENATTCPRCGAVVAQSTTNTPEKAKPNNLLTGIVGAVLGAALGALSIILIGRLGFVSALSGLILAVCTLKGYELLGGKHNKLSLLICFALMAITPYLANQIDWALTIAKEFDCAFSEAFANVDNVIAFIGAEAEKVYTSNLVMLYIFTALGAIGTLVDFFKKKKK